MSDCIVDGNIDPLRFLQFQKRSYDELHDLLFSNSLLLQEEQEREGQATAFIGPSRPKKKRKEKQVVMFTDPHTGARLRLYPTMSLWYVLWFLVVDFFIVVFPF